MKATCCLDLLLSCSLNTLFTHLNHCFKDTFLSIVHGRLQPTNDLDVDTLRCLEDAIQNFAGSTIIISHDRCVGATAFEHRASSG